MSSKENLEMRCPWCNTPLVYDEPCSTYCQHMSCPNVDCPVFAIRIDLVELSYKKAYYQNRVKR